MALGIIQLAKCLPYKHETPSLIPENHVQKPGLAVCACNATIGEAEAGRYPGAHWPANLSYLECSKTVIEPDFQKKVNNQ